MEIVDKRVVVTGAASGIGKALAIEFKNEKAKDVVLVDLNEAVSYTHLRDHETDS